MRFRGILAAMLVTGAFGVAVVAAQTAPTASNALTLSVLSRLTDTQIFDDGGAEIVAFHAPSGNVYYTNSNGVTVEIYNISDPAAPVFVGRVPLSQFGGGVTSVAVSANVIAAAVPANDTQANGTVVFFTPEGEVLSRVTVGALPDMVTFTPDGMKVLTANEGEPNDDYTVDPEGSVSIIDLSGGVENLTDANVTTVSFTAFNDTELDPSVRVFGPNATAAQDFEPEYIAVSPDGATAYVTLQENNAIAVIDIASGTVTEIRGLGFKDHSLEGNGLDPSEDDGGINIANWPVFGIYQPDAIAAFEVGGNVYYITANEGDTRDYDGYSEEADVEDLVLDPTVFPNAEELQADEALGGLGAVTSSGDIDGDGDFEAIYIPGGRSFSIYAADGTLVFESGDALEQITAAAYPDDFNSTHTESGSFDARSTAKGPEPEGVTVGVVDGVPYAFILLERIGGVVVFDVSDPAAPVFVTYVNNRDFSGDPEAGTAGDLGPEGVAFVSAEDSPTGMPLLLVANEISGTVTIFGITGGM